MIRMVCAAALLAAPVLAQCISPVNTVLPDSATNTYASGTSGFGATSTITAAGNSTSLTITGSANVTLTAGASITLQPGFHATALNGGATFKAQIEPVSQYQVTAIASPPAGGSVSLTPCSQTGYFGNGTTVTFQANAANGYVFASWSGGLSGTTNPQTIAITGPMNVTANFAAANPLQTFMTCVSASGTGSTCTLPANTYPITQTITIARSNLIIQGGTTNRAQTVLVRDPNFTGPLMDVNASQPPTGIKIQYLTFCGNSTLYNPNPNPACPAPVESSVVQTCNHETEYLTGNYPTNPGIPLCVDLYVHSADTGSNPPNPFTYTGPYSLEIANIDMDGATGHALAMWPDTESGERVNDIYIHDSTIEASGVTGILIGANGINYGPNGRVCDTVANYNNAFGLGPRNLRIENDLFQNNNTTAVGSESGRWIGLRNSTFVNNYINPQETGNEQGGNVFMDACSDTVQIFNNRMTGPTNPPYQKTSGLELWGRNIDAEDNNISGYPNEGIAANSTLNATIKNNQLLNNDTNRGTLNYSIGGIVVTTAGYGPCDGVPRDNQNTTISDNTSTGQAYGMDLFDRGISRNVIDNLRITGDNTLEPNITAAIFQRWMVTPNGFLNQSGYSPVLSQMPNDPPGVPNIGRVRALPILNSPQYPLCPASGATDADRDTFTFSAADAYGPSSLSDLEVVFSVGGNDADGSGGPDGGARGCHFIFFPSSSTLYLDGPNGGYNWIGSSVVGSGGTDLSNGYCTVHAGSSASQVQMGTRNLDLTLDMSFTSSSSHLHIYNVALDTIDGNYSSNGGNWYYWGWWAAP